VAIAVLDQIRATWRLEGMFWTTLLAAAAWGVCLVSVTLLAAAAPSVTDNRVRRFTESEEQLL
jgi:hypothetical protein